MATTRFTVTGTSTITPTIVRVHLRTDDLSAFAESRHADRYVKLVFPKPGVELPEQVDLRTLRGTMPPEDLPTVRTYTALNPDITAGTIDIDFVVHGDDGVAGPWAARAQPGDTLIASGPGGAYTPDPTADWHLLVGDESAIPAISAALGQLHPDAAAQVVLLIESPGHEPALELPRRAVVTHVYRAEGGSLTGVVGALDWPTDNVHAFVHGEAEETMKGLRPLLRARGLGRDRLSISGYWRRGTSEDGFRQWKAQLAREEGAD